MFIFKAHARLRALEERCEKLEREVRAAVADVDDAYERTRRLHGRIAKRAGVVELRDDAASAPSAPTSSIDLARQLARAGRAFIPGRRTNGGHEEG